MLDVDDNGPLVYTLSFTIFEADHEQTTLRICATTFPQYQPVYFLSSTQTSSPARNRMAGRPQCHRELIQVSLHLRGLGKIEQLLQKLAIREIQLVFHPAELAIVQPYLRLNVMGHRRVSRRVELFCGCLNSNTRLLNSLVDQICLPCVLSSASFPRSGPTLGPRKRSPAHLQTRCRQRSRCRMAVRPCH